MSNYRTLLILKSIFFLLLVFMWGCAGSQNPTKSRKKAETYLIQGLQQYKLMEYDKSEDLLKKAIKIDPKFAEAYETLGKIYLDQNKTELALDAYEKALEIDPMRVYSRLELSQVWFDKQEYDKCLETLQPVREIQAQNKQILTQVDQLYANASFAKFAIKNPVPFNPINAGDAINTAQEEYFPGLTVDEQKLFFTRRDGSISVYLQNEDLFYSEKENGKWKTAKNLGKPINTPENEGAFSTSADGQYLFFTSCSRPGGVGSCDIWVSKLMGERWSEPFNLGFPINTKYWETQPSLTADGKTLYYTSNNPDGYGGSDIWMTQFTDKGWSTPENLGNQINTGADEQFPFIHPDGQTLYFTSVGHPGMGKSDIFFAKKNPDGKWGKPVNMGYPINTAGDEWNLIVNRTGNLAYYASDGKKEGKGGMDIYSFELYEKARPLMVSYIKGFVFDANTKIPLLARIELLDPTTGKILMTNETNSKTGIFLATLVSNQNYILNVSSKGYLFYSESFFLKNSSSDQPYELQIGLNKIETGGKIVTRNIFFDVNKFDLKDESEAELIKLVEFLNNNEGLKVEIGGHTDNSGNAVLNKELSENRAKSVFNYCIQHGVKADRLTYKGYGASVPISPNTSEEGKALNRRTEFIIK
jgi:outer membrane protein OmpA-like peptidoglycan-associated protein